MQKKYLLFFFTLLFSELIFSQAESVISGSVVCNKIGVPNIKITNLINEKSYITNEFGNFSVAAKPDDMLVFISNNYEYKRRTLETEDFANKNFIIILDKKIEELDEVTVFQKSDKSPFDTEFSSVKTYTPAERRLKTAGVFKATDLLLIPFGGMPFDPIINAISGRTNQLKKELAVERNEKLLEKIQYLYTDEYYLKKLKIQPDYIKGFQYYAIYDFKLIAAINAKNKTLINFRMIELAEIFNKLQDTKN